MDLQGMREQIIANVVVVQKISKMRQERNTAEIAAFEPKCDRFEVVVLPHGDRLLAYGNSDRVGLVGAVVSCDSGSVLVQGQPKQGALASLDSLLLATVEMLRSYSKKTGFATLLTPNGAYVERTEHGLHQDLRL